MIKFSIVLGVFGFVAVIRRTGRQSLASLGASLFSGRVVWSCSYRFGRETARCVRILSLAFKVLAPRFGWAPSGLAYYFVDSPLSKPWSTSPRAWRGNDLYLLPRCLSS